LNTLRLDCLGSGHAFSHGRDWSGFLLNGRVLLDCPPQTLAALYRLPTGASAVAALDLILLSHLHADHVLGMDLLLLELEQGLASDLRGNRPLAVAGPLGTYDRLRAIVGDSDRLPSKDDPRLVWFEGDETSSFEWAGIEIERQVMEHDPRLVALGYRVRIDGALVAYTGDTRMTLAIEELAAGADVLVVECGGPPAEGKLATHLDWPDIIELRSRLPEATRMLVTHYDALTAPSTEARPRGITLAEDGAVYEW
jgi:ribonuclease BN (tRNA processing enzyme)